MLSSLAPGRYRVRLDRTVERDGARVDRGAGVAGPDGAAGRRMAVESGSGFAVEVGAGASVELRFAVRGQRLDGVVRTSDGRHVAGAEVWLAPWAAPLHPGERAAVTDAQGRFTLHAVEDRHWIGARASGFGPSRALGLWNPSAGSSRGPVELRLGPAGGDLAGRVVDPQGRPVPGASLVIGPGLFDRGSEYGAEEVWAENAPPVHLLADSEGRFAAIGLAPGENLVRVRARGFAPASPAVSIEVGARAETTIALEAGGSVGGRVVAAGGDAIQGATMIVRVGGEMVGAARTGPDGRYGLDGLPSGSVSVAADAPDHAPRRRSISVGSAAPTVCDFTLERKGTLAGRVTDDGGSPLASWAVVATPVSEDARPIWARIRGDGSFRMETEATGGYRLALQSRVERSGNAGGFLLAGDGDPEESGATQAGAQEIACSWLGIVGGEARDVAIVVPASAGLASVRGEVFDAGGKPVAGAVTAYRGLDEAIARARIGRDGAFQLGPFVGGDVRVIVQPASPEQPIAAVLDRSVTGRERVDLGRLRLPEPGTLVVLRGDHPVRPAIHANLRAGDRQVALLSIGPSGVARHALAPGRYKLDVFSLGPLGQRRSLPPQDVEVRAGEVSTVTLAR